MMVLFTTYLNCGWSGVESGEIDVDGCVVSATREPSMLLIIVVFQDSVSACE